jgi:DNA-binding transcriptional regulator YdaS (Cro superfamily)
MDTKAALEEAIRRAGGVSALARALGITQPSVSEWRARGMAPITRCPQIADLTEVPLHKLRPDVFPTTN